MICFAAGMLTYLLWICPLITLAFTLLPAPRNITVRSQNFQHILTWRPGGPSSTPSFFRVQYRNLHGNRKVYVPRHCSNTSDLSCDLTNELTEDAVYYLQVQHLSAVGNGSEWGNMEFNPFRDTELGPPVVHITSWSGCINVTIQPPVSHLKSEDKTRFRSMMDVYTMLRYSITLEGPGFHEKIDKDAHEENYSTIIKDLLPKTNYCVSVVVTATSNLSKHPKPSALQCLVTLSSTNITTGCLFSVSLLLTVELNSDHHMAERETEQKSKKKHDLLCSDRWIFFFPWNSVSADWVASSRFLLFTAAMAKSPSYHCHECTADQFSQV
ncbi:interferon alpha/beta receptor 2 isoform X3 [Ambystoma mexicanum]|uniref:interferon alpha/beta receptor 2 isoform X3 n=1 Tax=Ambystoma mexicanum TaxID=8296 RepID=UPI0037E785E0